MHSVSGLGRSSWRLTSPPFHRYNNLLKSMGATTSKEPQPGGSESRGGVTLVNTNNSTAESEVDKYDATSTSKRLKATARGHPALSSIVFRVGMFGYVQIFYARYFCWSLAQPQMPPDRRLPTCVGRLLSTNGWSRHLDSRGVSTYMTPRARSDTRLLRYALTD